MFILGAILLSLCAVSLLAAAGFFCLYRIFEYHPDKLGTVTATLKKTEHQNDLPVYERTVFRAPPRVVMIIKNWSKSVYEYAVNNKSYKIHYIDLVEARQMPYRVQVEYLLKFPKIAYVKTDTHFHHFDIYSFVSLMFAVMFALGGLSAIF